MIRTKEDLRRAIAKLTPEVKRAMPFPQDWIIRHQEMIELIDEGVLGMDGFQYQFREYAQECWRRCH